jgi:hypothetical protein
MLSERDVILSIQLRLMLSGVIETPSPPAPASGEKEQEGPDGGPSNIERLANGEPEINREER